LIRNGLEQLFRCTGGKNLKERTYLWYIALLRIYVGYYMLQQGIRKFQRDFPRGDWIGRQIGDLATIDLYPWYKKLLVDYVVPHQELFGYLVMSGEILVGACLLLGFLTRVSAFVALFMLINYYLGPGMARGGATMAQQQTFIVALIIFLLSNPGRALGLDGLIFRGGKGAR
jgi:thiosulfate dehydrogenase (quinone) large subunit